jgi:hypothetical protein
MRAPTKAATTMETFRKAFRLFVMLIRLLANLIC